MAEEADLSNYADCLCSCRSIITKLRNKGLLTSGEAQQAISYLSLHERPWPNETAIPDGAELYLDGLSVTYLNFVGATDKLKAAGLTAYITEAEDADANRLIAFEALTDRQVEIIEAIRSALAEADSKRAIFRWPDYPTTKMMILLGCTQPLAFFLSILV